MEGLYSKLPVNDFKWIENTSQFSKYFLGNYYEVGDNGYFLKLMFNILKIYIASQWFTVFTWKNENWKSRKTYR